MSEITDAELRSMKAQSEMMAVYDVIIPAPDHKKEARDKLRLIAALRAERAKVVELNEAIVRFIDVGLRYQDDSKADRALIAELETALTHMCNVMIKRCDENDLMTDEEAEAIKESRAVLEGK